jgi:hypothetical protein
MSSAPIESSSKYIRTAMPLISFVSQPEPDLSLLQPHWVEEWQDVQVWQLWLAW